MTGNRERSLQASPDGIKRANEALRRFDSQMALAAELGMHRTTVSKFFNAQSISRENFRKICQALELDWTETAGLPTEAEPKPTENEHNHTVNIDALVQEVRKKVKSSIQERCGEMKVLDMSQPIGLNDIYTNVNILERITGRRRKEITELVQECSNSENFERFGLARITEERVPGLDAVERYSKLMILGKPGAGKTTFLKYVAIQCNNCRGEFSGGVGAGLAKSPVEKQITHKQNLPSQSFGQTDNLSRKPALSQFVPIFVTLKNFAEAAKKPSLLEYISQQFFGCRVTYTQVADLFNHGRALVLLDGLDEVREEDSRRVLKEIRDLSAQFCNNNFVITCRIAAREYNFEKFTDVEIADFDEQQISTFAQKWFQHRDPVKAEKFVQKLEQEKPIKELATNPLLLTLLCLVFEESASFPQNRSELYEEGLNVLLKKWDAKRNIERYQVYKKLSLKRKEDLLSEVAWTTFERGDYFFKQKDIKRYIADYIRNLPDAQTEPEALHLDSEAVLKSVEAQHGLLVERARGIYSFSHLTFQEYFTARKVVNTSDPQASEEALQSLASHITEERWREVFLLAVEMSPSADRLLQLMKQQVDVLVAEDEKLQQFLAWVNQKSLSVQLPYTAASVRAFYLCLDDDIFYNLFLSDPFGLAHALGMDRDGNYSLPEKDFCVFKNVILLDHFFQITLDLSRGPSFHPNDALVRDLEEFLNHKLEPELKRAIEQLKDELPDPNQEDEGFQKWWSANGQSWGEELRAVMIKYRNIGHDWQFNWAQSEAFQQYYEANCLLVDCLNSDCYVSREVRQEIEDTLLLPIAEIEQRKGRLV